MILGIFEVFVRDIIGLENVLWLEGKREVSIVMISAWSLNFKGGHKGHYNWKFPIIRR